MSENKSLVQDVSGTANVSGFSRVNRFFSLMRKYSPSSR